ncbi:hypothetical protein SUGI_0114870 [Cryptomeria japonica]|uniref:uncharacterized protein LOC131054250 n=1 Tax=Cryptomeria japonica TaxID=3369 RepID=UPI002408EC46|nr:uncharacterized protein LOC131054250 [Cryptomeria japonica]XP_059072854.1 uncharacterized protein LOC131054250 [Cryptomeria japonica]GLJ09732.1 hypothetical protein SUGI_0114870 [Cryptomeria japonica]
MAENFLAPEISEDESKINSAGQETATNLMKLQLGCSSSGSAAPEKKSQQEIIPPKASQVSDSNEEDPSLGKCMQPGQQEPPFYEKFARNLGVRNYMSVIAEADMKFDKQACTSLRNKAGIYLPHPEIGKVLRMHDTPEKEFEASHEAAESADELVPVKLEDLKVGKRNECVVLYGELCVEPFKFGRIYTVLEEVDTNNVVTLSIVSPDPSTINQSFARHYYPKGMKIAVKEPQLVQSESGLIFIYVNNPLSIETLQSISPSADENVTVSKVKICKWMNCIQETIKAKEWKKCIRNCTKCEISYLKGMHVDEISILEVYLDRYHAQMQIGLYEGALEDTEKYTKMNPSDSFGVVCKIRSLLSLGRYNDAYRLLHHALAVDYYGDDVRKEFITFYRSWGSLYFDMGEAIIAEAGAGSGRPKCIVPDGDFLGPVEIRNTNYVCGRGLFATEDIEVGQQLLMSKALAISRKAMDDPIKNGLLRNVKDVLASCEDNTLKLFLCHARGRINLEGMIPRMEDFFSESGQDNNIPTSKRESGSTIPVREQYERLPDKDREILDILKRIALEDSSPAAMEEKGNVSVIINPVPTRQYYGVWLLVSFINHSCVPNATRINVGDIMRIHATKPIEKGQEITIPYFGVLVPYHLRQESCKAFGFCSECKCKRCKLEKKVIESESKAQRLYNDYQRFFISNKKNNATQLLQKFVNQTENCLEVLRHKKILMDKETEAWIRSSFMAAYLARIVCRKSRAEKKSVEEEEKTLLTAVRSVGMTCPGDIQYLTFCQSCFLFWRHLASNQLGSSLNIYAGLAVEFWKKACLFVYGEQRIDVMQLLWEKLALPGK